MYITQHVGWDLNAHRPTSDNKKVFTGSIGPTTDSKKGFTGQRWPTTAYIKVSTNIVSFKKLCIPDQGIRDGHAQCYCHTHAEQHAHSFTACELQSRGLY